MEHDSERFIRGQGRYVDDLQLPGMLHLKIVRSPYARAKILAVRGGITGHEFRGNLASVGEGAWAGAPAAVPFPVLATEYVAYAGQPVAAVTADDLYTAEDRMAEVDVEYEPLPPVVDLQAALEASPLHPGTTSNVASRVELGEDFEPHAPIVLEDELVNARISPNPMEARGIVAQSDGSDLTVWASTQSVHTWKEGLTRVFGLPRERVRVIAADTGGAFGSKSALYPEYAVACYVAMKARRPVKWVETRSEHLLATSHGRGASARMKVFADRTGHVEGLKAEILVDNGAYAVGIGAFAPRFIGFQITGPYAIGRAYVRGMSVYTNKVPLGPYRGAGRPEAAFFLERMLDLLADELRLDPLEVRRRNASPEPFASPTGLRIEPFEPFLRSATQALHAKDASGRPGTGFACFLLLSAVQPGESARIAVRDGRVHVWLGTSRGGQGHEILAQTILSEQLGVPPSAILLEASDTRELDEGTGTWGSRTAVVASNALVDVARQVRERVAREAGAYSASELLRRGIDVTVFHEEERGVGTFGAIRAGVTVDRETGEARVTDCASYYDIGRVVNPWMVESQSIGGAAQGIGQVLSEEVVYDADGQPQVMTLTDAGVLTAFEMPNVAVHLAPGPTGPGARIKGVGEASTVGVPPAVVRALETLVGRRLRRTPIHADELREQA